ncbi:hypothetical protein LLG95_12805 [bacterium]|nr:hypothetical protein [bacterium]
MSATGEQFNATHHDERMTRDFIGAGSAIAVLLGICSAAICISSLMSFYSVAYASLATILVGLALLIEGGSVVARSRKLVSGSEDIGWAISSENAVLSLVGIIGIVLGIMAWSRFDQVTLLAVASVIMGSGVLIESSSESLLGRLRLASYRTREPVERYTHQAVRASAGIDLVIGLAAMVLGVMALTGYASFTMIFVSMLTLSVGVLLGNLAIAGRFFGAFRER